MVNRYFLNLSLQQVIANFLLLVGYFIFFHLVGLERECSKYQIFLVFKKNPPNDFLETADSSTCMRKIKKLESHFYIVSISGCNGPLF